MALLQLPPFIGVKERARKVEEAYNLWYEALYPATLAMRLKTTFKLAMSNPLTRRNVESLLEKYTLVAGVSRAVAFEMGGEWQHRIYSLDPGVGLDDEEIEELERIKRANPQKKNYIVFGGMAGAPHKGFLEALLAFKAISSRHPELKLVTTGQPPGELTPRLQALTSRLGLKDRVVFTGYLSRIERLEVVRRASLTLYPAHLDAYPYAVLESLLLETPVVAYDLPALKMYFRGYEGITLVEEGDIETLAMAALETLEQGKRPFSPPRFRKWESIAAEERLLVEKLL